MLDFSEDIDYSESSSSYYYDKADNEEDINGFKNIVQYSINPKTNSLYNEIESETEKIHSYFMEKTCNFPILFEKDRAILYAVYYYLETNSIPNKCECAGIIDTIPGWRCNDCSHYDTSIYCSKCYIKSKHLHQGHKVYYLRSSGGMCDCGDPDALNIFCVDHCGPYTDQKKIDEIIAKSFPENLLNKLKEFFDEFFIRFSKYLLLTEKCKYFYTEILEEDILDNKDVKDINLLKKNFTIVFQNLLHFLFKLTEKNIGMSHLIASYLLKNHLKEEDTTCHSCIKIENQKFEILYKQNNTNLENVFSIFDYNEENKHKCECPFIRLLFTNWRNTVMPYSKDNAKENEKLLLSFQHNSFLKSAISILYFFLLKEILFNNNSDIKRIKIQFTMENINEFIMKETNLLEEHFDFLYYYLKKILNSLKHKDIFDEYKPLNIKKILTKMKYFKFKKLYLVRTKTRFLISSKHDILKRLVDISCQLQNKIKFKSIFPHPPSKK